MTQRWAGGMPKDYKYFSTKEKAEEYVLLNAQRLSIMDLLKNFQLAAPNHPYDSDWFNNIPLDTLKKLVKSKLK